MQQLANSPYELWLAAYEGRLTEEELLRCRERRITVGGLGDADGGAAQRG